MILVHNEQVKLTASALNTAAVGLMIAGLVSPIIASTYGVPSYQMGFLPVLRLVIWSIVGVLLHLIARSVLVSMRDE
jgi:hypothetical protein